MRIMSLIKCPECGREISDTVDKCPNCGFQIKKKKPMWLIIVAIICGVIAVLVLISAVMDFTGAMNSDKNEKTKISQSETEGTTASDGPAFDFRQNTDEELQSFPDVDGFTNVADTDFKDIMINIGVTNIDDAVVGNYKENSDVHYIDALCAVDGGKKLFVSYSYIGFATNPKWEITSVADYDSGQYYYVPGDLKDAYDIYDYKTGELISKATKTPEQVAEESKELLGVD